MLSHQCASLVNAELHYRAVEFRVRDNLSADIGLLDMVNEGRCRKTGRIVHVNALVLGRVNLVGHVRHSRDYIHIEFPEQPLLDDFEVEKAEEAAAESEAQGQ